MNSLIRNRFDIKMCDNSEASTSCASNCPMQISITIWTRNHTLSISPNHASATDTIKSQAVRSLEITKSSTLSNSAKANSST